MPVATETPNHQKGRIKHALNVLGHIVTGTKECPEITQEATTADKQYYEDCSLINNEARTIIAGHSSQQLDVVDTKGDIIGNKISASFGLPDGRTCVMESDEYTNGWFFTRTLVISNFDTPGTSRVAEFRLKLAPAYTNENPTYDLRYVNEFRNKKGHNSVNSIVGAYSMIQKIKASAV
jgi:hypothetical protein